MECTKGIFKQLSSMNERRYAFPLFMTNSNEIYAIGGFDYQQKYGNHCLDKCEKYIINENKWISLPNLQQGRNPHGASYFHSNSHYIYVFGGFGVPHQVPTQNIERLLEGEEKWKIVNLVFQMEYLPTYQVQCRAISSLHILIFGHHNYIYNVNKGTIEETERAPNSGHLANYRVSCVEYKHKFYCFNNANGNQLLLYNLREGKWNSINC